VYVWGEGGAGGEGGLTLARHGYPHLVINKFQTKIRLEKVIWDLAIKINLIPLSVISLSGLHWLLYDLSPLLGYLVHARSI
jgi:hypothetical protein